MDTHDDRAGPGAQKGEQGPPSRAALPPDRTLAQDSASLYATPSSDASQFAASSDAASPADQCCGPDVSAPGGLGSEDTGGLAVGFPPDDGPVLWQRDLGVQGRFRTSVRVIGLEDGGQRARLLKSLVFRPSRLVQEGQAANSA